MGDRPCGDLPFEGGFLPMVSQPGTILCPGYIYYPNKNYRQNSQIDSMDGITVQFGQAQSRYK